ncbi:MAG: hypothetical protein Q8Q08_12785 [Candidatus Omnitrophota bacterium]|nr:hypothetical protein [Candidatus Omnitrophota bacterium]
MQTFKTGQKTVTVSGTPEQLGSGKVPSELVIKALAANTGTICVGYSSATAQKASGDFFPLAAGESLALATDNLDDIWLDVMVSSDGVAYAHEVQIQD